MTHEKRHSRKTAVITGGSAGIGRAIAFRFAAAGYHVGLIARDEVALIEACNAIRAAVVNEHDQIVTYAAADVAEADAVFAAAGKLEREMGKVDVWINDAMETCFSLFVDMTPDEFRRVTEVTYLGFVHGTMAALKSMRPRGQGHILQIGSALAYRGIPLQSAYCGAKHAIKGFTESIRCELLAEKSPIKLTVIDLPAVNTPQFDWARSHLRHKPRPMGTPYQPSVVADAVFAAVNGRYREYWLGLPTMATTIANTLAPAYLDRYLARHAINGQQGDEVLDHDQNGNLDHPVSKWHRTRGSFNEGAKTRALTIPGGIGRVGTVALGATLCLAFGMVLGRGAKRK